MVIIIDPDVEEKGESSPVSQFPVYEDISPAAVPVYEDISDPDSV